MRRLSWLSRCLSRIANFARGGVDHGFHGEAEFCDLGGVARAYDFEELVAEAELTIGFSPADHVAH